MLLIMIRWLYHQAVRVCHFTTSANFGSFTHHSDVNRLIKMKNPAMMAGFGVVWSRKAGSRISLRGGAWDCARACGRVYPRLHPPAARREQRL